MLMIKRLFYCFSILIVSPLLGGEEHFIYKGIPRVAKSLGGIPIAIGDISRIAIRNVRPIVIQDPKTGICTNNWEFVVMIFEKGLYLGELTCEESPDLEIQFNAYFQGESYPLVGSVVVVRGADRSNYPLMWNWADASGATWLPFKFKFTKIDEITKEPIKSDTPIIITQWIKLFPRDATTLMNLKNEFIATWKSRRSVHAIRTQDGESYDINLLDNFPVLEDTDLFTIESIQPIIGSNGINKTRTAAWLVMFNWKDTNRSVTIEISDIKNTYKSKTHLIKQSFGKIYFGIKEDSPAFWGWVKINGDSWIPFRFRITPENGNSIDLIQWVKLSEKAKNDWKKMK